MEIHMFPSESEIVQNKTITPKYMVPSDLPYGIILEGVLKPEECDVIRAEFMQLEPYSVPHCNAITREKIGNASSLEYVYLLSKMMNEKFWRYDLNDQTAAWMQTYGQGNDYELHMDGSPGQVRKLTAVVLLTPPELYSGGDLVLSAPPRECVVPRTQGTIVYFLPWVLHRVDPILNGTRQTINLGYWGPPFR